MPILNARILESPRLINSLAKLKTINEIESVSSNKKKVKQNNENVRKTMVIVTIVMMI